MVLDPRTVLIVYSSVTIICTIIFLQLWLQNRKHFNGISLWFGHFVLQSLSIILISLRNIIPDLLSIVAANFLIISSMIIFYQGLLLFVGVRKSQIHNYVFLAIFTYVHYYFTFIENSLNARNINLSIGIIFVCSQLAWLSLAGPLPSIRKLTRRIGIVYSIYVVVSLSRIIFAITNPQTTNDFIHSNSLDISFTLIYTLLFILLTYSVSLMINHRLLMEVEKDEETFAKAFHSSPYGITLTKIDTGEIVDVNDGFIKITGYEREEILGKTTIDLKLWNNPDDRVSVVKELKEKGRVSNLEFKYRKKSGEVLTGLISAEIIKLGDETLVLSSINDISNLKSTAEELQKKIEELEKLNSYMVNREIKMIELKNEISAMRKKLESEK